MPSFEELAQKKNISLQSKTNFSDSGRSFESLAKQKNLKPLPATTEQPEQTGILSKISSGINKGLDITEDVIRATQIPKLIGGAVSLAGKAVGGVVGGGARVAQNILEGKPLTQDVAESAFSTAKETGEFGKQIGEEGAVAAPFAGLGKIPSAVISAPALYEGIKEKDPTKIAIGGIGLLGAKSAKGKFIDESIYKTIKRPPNIPKLTEESTGIMRTILKPSKGDLMNVEIRGGKNIDDYYKLAAEEQLPINQVDKNLDTIEARNTLKPKQEQIHNVLNDILATDQTKQFDLLEVGNKAKKELKIKNATEKLSAEKEIDEFIADEIADKGRFVNGQELNNIKSGFWGVGYNQIKPTAQANARRLGHVAKEMIEKANSYQDLAIKDLNELSGKYATLSHLLENAHGRKIQGGNLARYAAQVTGAISGVKIPFIGAPAGHYLGGKVSEAIYSPERLSAKAAKKIEKAGQIGRSFKETTGKASESLLKKKSQLNNTKLLPAPPLRLPAQMGDKGRSFIQILEARKGVGREKTGKFKKVYYSS